MKAIIALDDAKELVKKYTVDGYYDSIGIRVQEQPFELGAISHTSKVWVDGEETDEDVDGICAIDLKDTYALTHCDSYFGDHVAIICGESVERGDDLGEIIIRNGEVVEILA